MFSGSVTVANPPQLYFCHRCNRNVSITPIPNSELICPTCQSGFLEEVEQNPHPVRNTNPQYDRTQNPILSLFSQLNGGGNSQFRRGLSLLNDPFVVGPTLSRAPGGAGGGVVPEEVVHDFSPFAFLQEYVTNARASGNEFHVLVNGQSLNDPAFEMAGDMGDYFIGPGFEQLVQQLSENDPTRQGPPPAPRSAIEGVPNVVVDECLLKSEWANCAVCFDEFEVGRVIKQMPCKHVYHSECLVPWLERHNSCPVCRAALPTAADESSGSSGSGSNGGGDSGGQARQRRFRFNLNWPSVFGGWDGGDNDGGSSSGGPGLGSDLNDNH